jgi:hypothetical protein
MSPDQSPPIIARNHSASAADALSITSIPGGTRYTLPWRSGQWQLGSILIGMGVWFVALPTPGVVRVAGETVRRWRSGDVTQAALGTVFVAGGAFFVALGLAMLCVGVFASVRSRDEVDVVDQYVVLRRISLLSRRSRRLRRDDVTRLWIGPAMRVEQRARATAEKSVLDAIPVPDALWLEAAEGRTWTVAAQYDGNTLDALGKALGNALRVEFVDKAIK